MGHRGKHKKEKYCYHPIVKIYGLEIAHKMMQYQMEQHNPPNLDVFIREPTASTNRRGFNWDKTEEGYSFWADKMISLYHNHIRKEAYNTGKYGKSW